MYIYIYICIYIYRYRYRYTRVSLYKTSKASYKVAEGAGSLQPPAHARRHQ